MERNTNSYKVVVVDDEGMVVKAICCVLEKYCPKFEAVGTARNGKEALEIISEVQPDLVLTDVDMPLMNGLELVQKAGERMPDLCFVIISGYQDFEYVRDAFRGGVLDYLTKPIVPSQMLETMKNVEEKLKQKYYNKQISILRKLCIGETVALEEIETYFPWREFYAALLRENGLPRRYSPAKEPELYGTIDEAYMVYGRDCMEELFLIPREFLGEQSLLEYMTKVEQRQKNEGSYTTILYYGEAFSAPEISEKIRNLYYGLSTLSSVGVSQVVDLDKKEYLEERLRMPGMAEISNLLKEMEQYAHTGRYEQVWKCIGEEFARWGEEKRPQIWLEQASRRILNFVRMMNKSEESLIESEYQLEDAFYYSTSMEMLWKSLYGPYHHLQEKENYKVDSPEFFENIIWYLNEHISEQLSLQAISDLFAISQAYMSKLFRKYTKESYGQYLTGIRMERAKQLMEANREFLVKDIAEMVGYRDQFYFSRIFRGYTGKSPAEYLK